MTIEKKTRPYEILVRFGEGGILSGAHVRYIDEAIEDGKVIAGKEGHAIPISASGDFPLQKFLPDIQAGAIASAERAWAETAEAKKAAHEEVAAAGERTALAMADAAEARGLLAKAKALNADLQAQLQKLLAK